jgi:hypothetical protein
VRLVVAEVPALADPEDGMRSRQSLEAEKRQLSARLVATEAGWEASEARVRQLEGMNVDLARDLDAINARVQRQDEEIERLGNQLAQERSKPGGSFDQAARVQRLENALRGTRDRTDENGDPCWCPDWMYEDWVHGFTEDRVHHECCATARAELSVRTPTGRRLT